MRRGCAWTKQDIFAPWTITLLGMEIGTSFLDQIFRYIRQHWCNISDKYCKNSFSLEKALVCWKSSCLVASNVLIVMTMVLRIQLMLLAIEILLTDLLQAIARKWNAFVFLYSLYCCDKRWNIKIRRACWVRKIGWRQEICFFPELYLLSITPTDGTTNSIIVITQREFE